MTNTKKSKLVINAVDLKVDKRGKEYRDSQNKLVEEPLAKVYVHKKNKVVAEWKSSSSKTLVSGMEELSKQVIELATRIQKIENKVG